MKLNKILLKVLAVIGFVIVFVSIVGVMSRYAHARMDENLRDWGTNVPKIAWESSPAKIVAITAVEPEEVWQITIQMSDGQSRHILTEKEGYKLGDLVTYGDSIVQYAPMNGQERQHFIGKKVAK